MKIQSIEDNTEVTTLTTFVSYAVTMILIIFGNCLVGEHLRFEVWLFKNIK